MLVVGSGLLPLTNQPEASLPSKSRRYPCCFSADESWLSAAKAAAATASEATARHGLRRMGVLREGRGGRTPPAYAGHRAKSLENRAASAIEGRPELLIILSVPQVG